MEQHSDSTMEMGCPSQELYKDGVLTLGCIGAYAAQVLLLDLIEFKKQLHFLPFVVLTHTDIY